MYVNKKIRFKKKIARINVKIVYSYHYFVHIYHAEQDKIDAYQNCFYIKKFFMT